MNFFAKRSQDFKERSQDFKERSQDFKERSQDFKDGRPGVRHYSATVQTLPLKHLPGNISSMEWGCFCWLLFFCPLSGRLFLKQLLKLTPTFRECGYFRTYFPEKPLSTISSRLLITYTLTATILFMLLPLL